MPQQLTPTQRTGFRNWFSEAFINAHIEGGTDLSAIKNRQKRDPTVRGSTLLTLDRALQLMRDFVEMERGETSTKLVKIFPNNNLRYSYNQPGVLINFDEDGDVQYAYGTIEIHVYLDPTDNQKRKINHLHSQNSRVLKKNQIKV